MPDGRTAANVDADAAVDGAVMDAAAALSKVIGGTRGSL